MDADTNGSINKFTTQLAAWCARERGVEFHTGDVGTVVGWRISSEVLEDSATQRQRETKRVAGVITRSGEFQADNVVVAAGDLLQRLCQVTCGRWSVH